MAETKENLKKILKKQREEYQNYLGVAIEEFKSDVGAIAEQYGDIKEILDMHTEILGRHTEILKEHTKNIGSIKEDLEIIKEDVEFIKGSLKKKVDVDEFSALERRVTLLEKRPRLASA